MKIVVEGLVRKCECLVPRCHFYMFRAITLLFLVQSVTFVGNHAYYHCETLLRICYGIEGSSVIIPVIPSTLLISGI